MTIEAPAATPQTEHKAPWHQQHRGYVWAAVGTLFGIAYKTGQQFGWLPSDDYVFPFVVLGVVVALLYLAATSEKARKVYAKYGEQEDVTRRVLWAIAGLAAVLVILVLLTVGFTTLQKAHAAQMARVRGELPTPPVQIFVGTKEEQNDKKSTGTDNRTQLVDPLETLRQQNAAQMTQFQQELTKAVAAAVTDALRANTQLAAQNRTPVSGAAQPTAALQPDAPAQSDPAKPLPQVTIALGPATNTSCAQFGVGDGPISNNQKDFLDRLPQRRMRFSQGIMPRLIAAAKGDIENKESQGNVVNVLNGWNSQIEADMENAFDDIARLDLRNATPSEDLLKTLPDVPFSDGAKDGIRRATVYLSCLLAIEANLRARPGLSAQ